MSTASDRLPANLEIRHPDKTIGNSPWLVIYTRGGLGRFSALPCLISYHSSKYGDMPSMSFSIMCPFRLLGYAILMLIILLITVCDTSPGDSVTTVSPKPCEGCTCRTATASGRSCVYLELYSTDYLYFIATRQRR